MIMIRRKAREGGAPAKFQPGDLVRHRRYGYRGVVADFDDSCQAPDDWYLSNQTQPAREQAWYHVLVDGSTHVTYAAEENLEPAPGGDEITHPLVAVYFVSFEDGRYVRNERPWGSD